MIDNNLEVLILGGTGAIGICLIQILNEKGCFVYVTSRTEHKSYGTIKFIRGNAKDLNFLNTVLEKRWDAIIDLMSYSTDEFSMRKSRLLSATSQYIFISSARVYANSNKLIDECSLRLLDTMLDKEYLATDEYALSKARQEDLLRSSGNNWTIIRPSITYSETRLQLGALEKENWLYRALKGRSIVFSKDLADIYTPMTTGSDVAYGIVSLIGEPNTYMEVFNIVSNKSYKWKDVLEEYLKIIEERIGKRPKVYWTNISTNLKFEELKYQVIYCRYFNRYFDNNKIKKYMKIKDFDDLTVGLRRCLSNLSEEMNFREINWKIEAVNDREACEITYLKEIPSIKKRLIYVIYRYNLVFIIAIYKIFINLKNRYRKRCIL